jgi:3'(2'), 5'-bisphosphate nucleotidase
MHSITYQEYLAASCAVARDAGALIMGYFSGGFTTSRKQDKSPVTDADIAANQLIVKALSALTPDIPIVAEEDEAFSDARHARFWLVDPLDGTRSFVRGEPEFTVNIGLVENRRPVLGVLYVPATQRLYWGGPGLGAFRQQGNNALEAIHTRIPDMSALVIARSRSQPSKAASAWLATLSIKEILPSSSAAKFGQVAEGSADLYPRFGRTMEWDTAAGHAILEAAGGRVETVDGAPLTYGKPGFENPGFIAYGK